MANYFQNEFSKELSELFTKYNKAIQSDKNGIYIIDTENPILFILSEATEATEDSRTKLFTLYK